MDDDHTHLYVAFEPTEYLTVKTNLEAYMSEIHKWLKCNCLELNDEN